MGPKQKAVDLLDGAETGGQGSWGGWNICNGPPWHMDREIAKAWERTVSEGCEMSGDSGKCPVLREMGSQRTRREISIEHVGLLGITPED